ncbi:unnamed protein product [Enterobius vermicularis]|uniref:ANF_receptor domain-containing protein n=1 Tax=Enterobius vermicularis TaxID=51028 RepID=A0A0N4UU50_ENTVE|nr:unnamed protein product [Enterobius vermicularis]
MPAYWSLGFQLSRYGYTGLDEVKTVVQRNLDKKIPLEVVYADVDYMERYADFTLGDVKILLEFHKTSSVDGFAEQFFSLQKWKGFGNYAEELHNKNIKVILIFDPAVDVTTEAFQEALEANVSFIEYRNESLVQSEVNKNYTDTNGTKVTCLKYLGNKITNSQVSNIRFDFQCNLNS